MAKLSDIVGGLMRDLSQSHALVDDHTRETLEKYSKDPVLCHFPVPRLSITSATLRLKFVIKDQQPPREKDDPADYQAIWGKALRERIVPKVLERLGRNDNRLVTTRMASRLARPEIDREISVEKLLDAEGLRTVEAATVDLLVREVQNLPKSVARLLPGEELLRRAAAEVCAAEIPEVGRAALSLHEARTVSMSNLDVSVNAAELKEVPPTQVSELEFTVAIEDIEQGGES